ncbi:unnamed protein product [Vitrella brassicaformis CCMP3155]|uniref:Uncharacterized protein n=1 Tax=Vitrella brassicaformis (strain CCMP3155) TaxID=1169540 RepID=A0A0G4FAN9_VITBC|nr:unnamed protein product [Vitrella brassicaformis CCMP3155]|eukprot:CEM09692.1 unnamed protein product [Vitrella brassicaformis CCMP3155]
MGVLIGHAACYPLSHPGWKTDGQTGEDHEKTCSLSSPWDLQIRELTEDTDYYINLWDATNSPSGVLIGRTREFRMKHLASRAAGEAKITLSVFSKETHGYIVIEAWASTDGDGVIIIQRKEEDKERNGIVIYDVKSLGQSTYGWHKCEDVFARL